MSPLEVTFTFTFIANYTVSQKSRTAMINVTYFYHSQYLLTGIE